MAFLTSIAGSGTGQYFADENSLPYLVRWDTVWALVTNAGNSGGATTWQSDIDGYCAARAGQGFNGFLVTTTGLPQSGGPNLDGSTWDGVAPFTSPGVLNDPYWQRVDYLLNAAAVRGMTVVLNVMFTYAMGTSGACLFGWTNPQFTAYGTALGNRYGSQANFIWEFGDDYDPGSVNRDTAFSACLTGIRGTGDTHLISIENLNEGTSRYSLDGTTSWSWGISNAQLNWCYSYGAAYLAVEDAYKEAAAHSTTSLLTCKMDGWYDNQWQGATPSESIELFGRKWVWWSLSSGSRGTMYGNGDLYSWPSGALASGLPGASPGAQYIQPAALNAAWNAFASLQGWNRLVPDTASALVTAGRGTRATEYAVGVGGNTGFMYAGGNTYVTASKTADNTLAVIYIPSNVTITVNGGAMATGYQAKWIDPANGTTSAATIASTYNNPAANSAGDHDWVLLLAIPPYATWAVP
jgi:hypothetical protein